MKAVAAWLVARPQNAIIVLAGTIALAAVPALALHLTVLSSVTLIAVALHDGVRTAVIKLAFAMLLAVAAGWLAGIQPAMIVGGAMTAWLPSLLLAVMLLWSRSLTLTMQLSVIVAAAVMLAFLVAVDAKAFWLTLLETWVEIWRETGQADLAEVADLLEQQMEMVAEYATLAVVLLSWVLQATGLALGYALYRMMPGEPADFGRFRALNFGRVIALTMAIASVLSTFVDAVWLKSFAFFLFAAFWLQGLAVVHWMHARGIVQAFGIIATYALMLVAGWIVIPALAVFGYTDAWFDFRRMLRQRENRTKS